MKNIKYTRLNFIIQLEDACILPENKESMLSRSFLNQLCKLYCINNKDCKNCSNISNCIIQQIMNGIFNCSEALMKQTFYYPYIVFICDDHNKNYRKEDLLKFEIRAFGFVVNLVSQFIYIFERIGTTGMGLGKIKFSLKEINNEDNQSIYKDGSFIQDNIKINDITEYVKEKGVQLRNFKFNVVRFTTPIVLSNDNINKYSFNVDLIGEYIKTRLKSFNILEDEDILKIDKVFSNQNNNLEYSFNLKPIKYRIKKENNPYVFFTLSGNIVFNEAVNECINCIKACEMFLIGEKVLMGFGKYELERGKKYEQGIAS